MATALSLEGLSSSSLSTLQNQAKVLRVYGNGDNSYTLTRNSQIFIKLGKRHSGSGQQTSHISRSQLLNGNFEILSWITSPSLDFPIPAFLPDSDLLAVLFWQYPMWTSPIPNSLKLAHSVHARVVRRLVSSQNSILWMLVPTCSIS